MVDDRAAKRPSSTLILCRSLRSSSTDATAPVGSSVYSPTSHFSIHELVTGVRITPSFTDHFVWSRKNSNDVLRGGGAWEAMLLPEFGLYLPQVAFTFHTLGL